MKKISLALIIAAFAWSIQACANRTNNENNENLGDSLNHDTVVTPPLDTTNRTLDTMNMNRDTLGMGNPIDGDQ